MAITGGQIRAARAFLRWTAKELAQKSGVSLPTIKRMEGHEGVPSSLAQTVEAVTKCFQNAGVEFWTNEGAVGVVFQRGKYPSGTLE